MSELPSSALKYDLQQPTRYQQHITVRRHVVFWMKTKTKIENMMIIKVKGISI
jgi:hypothetical protein